MGERRPPTGIVADLGARVGVDFVPISRTGRAPRPRAPEATGRQAASVTTSGSAAAIT
jgi:hypothetical protein